MLYSLLNLDFSGWIWMTLWLRHWTVDRVRCNHTKFTNGSKACSLIPWCSIYIQITKLYKYHPFTSASFSFSVFWKTGDTTYRTPENSSFSERPCSVFFWMQSRVVLSAMRYISFREKSYLSSRSYSCVIFKSNWHFKNLNQRSAQGTAGFSSLHQMF